MKSQFDYEVSKLKDKSSDLQRTITELENASKLKEDYYERIKSQYEIERVNMIQQLKENEQTWVQRYELMRNDKEKLRETLSKKEEEIINR